jgi:hypothetical protein
VIGCHLVAGWIAAGGQLGHHHRPGGLPPPAVQIRLQLLNLAV